MEQARLERARMESATLEILQTQVNVRTARLLARSFKRIVARLQVLGGYILRRAASPTRKLAVRESAALGDRRFVSVIQFERQRFLIGCSHSSVRLLTRLPDEPSKGDLQDDIAPKQRTEASGEKK